MACAGEKSDDLETLLVTSEPGMNVFLGDVAILPTFSIVYRGFDIADSFVILILSPVKGRIGLEIDLLSSCLF